MRAVLAACAGEWRRIAADPGAMLILVGAVVLYSLFYPQPYLPEVLKEVPTVIVDHDGTPLSRRLARMADASEYLRVVARTPDLVAAADWVRLGDAGALLEIPDGFEHDVLRGQAVTVGCFTDAAYFLVYRQATTGLIAAARTFSAGIEIRRMEAAGMAPGQARVARDPVPTADRPLYNSAEGYASYIVPGVLVLILQQTLLIGIGMLAGTDRERGLPATPERPLTLVLGRVLAYFVVYLAHAVFYFVVVYRIFNLPFRGDLAVTFVFTVPFLLAAICFALAISVFFSERETALQVLLFTSLPALFLAGFSWPLELVPWWLRSAALLLPSTAAIDGLLRINQMGASLAEVVSEWRLLWCLAGAYFLLAWWAHARRVSQIARPGVARDGAGGEDAWNLSPPS